MNITIEISTMQEMKQLLQMLKSLNITNISIKEMPSEHQPTITKGDKTLDPQALFGIWLDQPRTLEQVRTEAWKRNWNI
jgi:hypothetical protein